MRKTKIVCTIGPASETKEIVKGLCEAGMNVARLNFSHNTHADHQRRIDLVKKVRSDLKMPIAIMLDTKGPEYRIKTFKNQKITLNDICANAGIGKNKCTELFRRYTNMSPMEYLRHYRVEKGVQLLKDTDLSVTEIAYEVGMSGASYFAESLRICRGCTPTQIRKGIE